MLDVMRKKSGSFVVIFLFGIIIIVFAFWVPNMGDTGSGGERIGPVAFVDGEPIGYEDYAEVYQRRLDNYRRQMGEAFTDDFLESLNLRESVLNGLVNRVLVMKEAIIRGLKVSDREVQDTIMSLPAFNREGAFDRDAYFDFLRRNRLRAVDFESGIKSDILTSKIQNEVTVGVTVGEDELKTAFVAENRRVSFDYLAVKADSFEASLDISDDEARDFLEANGRLFKEPTKVNVAYVRLGYADAAMDAEVSDEAVGVYYGNNQGEFIVPEKVKARHILVRRVATDGDEASALEEARVMAEAVLAKVKDGEDFSALAKVHSQDTGSAKLGGDLGFFGRGLMVKPFEDAAFSLAAGEVSGLVETEYGFHIIKVDERKAAGSLTLEEASDEIRKKLSDLEGVKAARDKAEKLQKAFIERVGIEALRTAAEGHSTELTVTGFFSETDRSVELAQNRRLVNTVFMLAKGDVRGREADGAIFIMKVIERVEEHVPDYEVVASGVKKAFGSEKASSMAREKAAEVLVSLKGGASMADAARDGGYETGTTGMVTKKDGVISDLGVFVGGRDDLFTLTTGAPYYPEVLGQADTFYVLRLLTALDADDSLFDEQRAAIEGRIIREKRDELLSKWIEELRGKADIQVNEELL